MIRAEYSVAIRTLGTGGEKYRRELESLHRQTLMPRRIIVYIAQGYDAPDWRVGIEEYVWVPKGMLRQRALQYREIDTEYILTLDDDVELQADSAEKLVKAMERYEADFVAADTFRNQDMGVIDRIKGFVANWARPRCNDGRAFVIDLSGSFSYNAHPKADVCPTQSAAGPAAMWRKSSLIGVRLQDELWLEEFPFAFGDDQLWFYKAWVNGMKTYVHYNAGIEHLDGRSESNRFRANPKKLIYRAQILHILWHRTVFARSNQSKVRKVLASILWTAKVGWLAGVHMALSVVRLSPLPIVYYAKGIYRGIKYVHSEHYRNLPSYILK
ncbi:MAG: glycosyltransferase [Bacteroides sp.]|nr:glycosyltransferase [Bacteroides sp.]MCM1094727.1 glycosyltransferase [Terasakiella sp.]